ncbi:hypothetical protein JCM16358_25250 [Halanaerocella petrolearia]
MSNKKVDIDKVAKKFYRSYTTIHNKFMESISGIEDNGDKEWYSSVMLNRLMITYFIQEKGLLNNNVNYLKDRFENIKTDSFYRDFLLKLFYYGLNSSKTWDDETEKLIGQVPYLNGGIFDIHSLEEKYTSAKTNEYQKIINDISIEIDNNIFKEVINFFDRYDWSLYTDKERQSKEVLDNDNQITPRILGYIFEKYINQKEKGAYYTKKDTTEYITQYTIIPSILHELSDKLTSDQFNVIWDTLNNNPRKYIYSSEKLKQSINEESFANIKEDLPAKVKVGFEDISKRFNWDRIISIDEELEVEYKNQFSITEKETWREIINKRRQYNGICKKIKDKTKEGRYSINDLITDNLNLKELIKDVIKDAEGEFIRELYYIIAGKPGKRSPLSILDPACGSGAFLFSALDILEFIYERCIDRIETDFSNQFKGFKTILDRINSHQNRKYFIYKSIISNNLYGVDIMEEAVEITKMRLFLKLISLVDDYEEVEPLPNIDFNILPGNSLIGFSNLEFKNDIKNTIKLLKLREKYISLKQEYWSKEKEYEEIKNRFRNIKEEYTSKKDNLKLKLDDLLAKEYLKSEIKEESDRLFELKEEYIRSKEDYLTKERNYKEIKFKYQNIREQYTREKETLDNLLLDECLDMEEEEFKEEYKPFHWFLEFSTIIVENGGFDCIIGNPPYVQHYKVEYEKTGYREQYETEKCYNLAALITERSYEILKDEGHLGLINPISIVSTPTMSSLRNLILDNSQYVYYSNFGDRPGDLFEGVHQKLSILLSRKNSTIKDDDRELFTTKYYHWYSGNEKNEREFLFDNIKYVSNQTSKDIEDCVLKLGSNIGKGIWNKIQNKNKSLYDLLDKKTETPYSIYLSKRMTFWTKCFLGFGTEQKGLDSDEFSNEFDKYYLESDQQAKVIMAVLNSNLFFYFWEVVSDCWHITNKELELFKVDVNSMKDEIKEKLVQKAVELEQDIAKHKKDVNTKQTSVEYKHKKSKNIIDEIDKILAEYYGFTDQEVDYLRSYNLKYRASDYLENYIDKISNNK